MKYASIIKEILPHYFDNPDEVQLIALGEGNINDTYLASSSKGAIILQRINSLVFDRPEHIIRNLEHITRKLQATKTAKKGRWEDVQLLPTRKGKPFTRDRQNNIWRALSYIENSVTLNHIENTQQARCAGQALGRFHQQVASLDIHVFTSPLPGFHVLSGYLNTYDSLSRQCTDSDTIRRCDNYIQDNRYLALSFERNIKEQGIPLQITHGDPKIGNILFDQETKKAVSIIDLDTVGPGYLHHDIGDCLRSVCNRSGETGTDSIEFDLSLCEATLQGYFQETTTCMAKCSLIFDALRAITFELGLRFFTDHLNGNIYFKCKGPTDNLQKALVQFKLCADISRKEKAIRALTNMIEIP